MRRYRRELTYTLEGLKFHCVSSGSPEANSHDKSRAPNGHKMDLSDLQA